MISAKKDIVNLVLSGKVSLSQIAEQNHIQINQIHTWRKKLEKLDKAFGKSKKERTRKNKVYKKKTLHEGNARIDKDVEKLLIEFIDDVAGKGIGINMS